MTIEQCHRLRWEGGGTRYCCNCSTCSTTVQWDVAWREGSATQYCSLHCVPHKGTTRNNAPATVQPATVQPAASEPATVQPATAQPATSQPATVQPATAQPATVQPATSQPATVQPATVQPHLFPAANQKPRIDEKDLDLRLSA